MKKYPPGLLRAQRQMNVKPGNPAPQKPEKTSPSVRVQVNQAFNKTVDLFKLAIPTICGVLLLVSLMHQFLHHRYEDWFTGNYLIDPLIGAITGSISFGIPITSYVAAGELRNGGVSLIAVTAFIMTWTTVGLVMIPLETAFLGKRFALVRNALNFIFAILVAIATVYTLERLP